jgi:OOP family OmpA-OmpF porin
MPAKPADADMDGVVDSADRCPGTPDGVSVDAAGCPLDSDGDGVYDYQDQCPDTKASLKVDEKGCPMALTESVSIDLTVTFDNNSEVVKESFFEEIKSVADFMNQYEGTSVVIEGHTDDRGSAEYNRNLSDRRAKAVAKVLVERFGIDSSRVSAIGYGEAQPIASNDTAEGRVTNRRVVAKVSSQVEKMMEK